MSPDECPKCGAAFLRAIEENGQFTCGSVLPKNRKTVWSQTAICLTRQRDQLAARVKRLEEAGDSLADATIPNGRSHERWKEAKEAKP